jgi:hypothetical protein
MLAAITETSGIEPNAALDRADSAAGQLNDAGYPDEWEVARILARHTPEELAGLMRLRIDGIRAEKIRPDASGTVTLAALLTLGASVPPSIHSTPSSTASCSARTTRRRIATRRPTESRSLCLQRAIAAV